MGEAEFKFSKFGHLVQRNNDAILAALSPMSTRILRVSVIQSK